MSVHSKQLKQFHLWRWQKSLYNRLQQVTIILVLHRSTIVHPFWNWTTLRGCHRHPTGVWKCLEKSGHPVRAVARRGRWVARHRCCWLQQLSDLVTKFSSSGAAADPVWHWKEHPSGNSRNHQLVNYFLGMSECHQISIDNNIDNTYIYIYIFIVNHDIIYWLLQYFHIGFHRFVIAPDTGSIWSLGWKIDRSKRPFFGAQKPGVLMCFPLHQCVEKIELPPLLFCSGKRCNTSWLAPLWGRQPSQNLWIRWVVSIISILKKKHITLW